MKFLLVVSFLFIPKLLFSQVLEFHWLVGTWQQENDTSFEVWKHDHKILTGISYKINDKGDKIIAEEIKLMKRDNDFYYVPDVAGAQKPVEFKITSLGENNFVSENPSHDFPKKIIYNLIDRDHLVASVENENKMIRYSFKKIK